MWSTTASVLIDYGRGTSPILPLSVECDGRQNSLTDCLREELDPVKCTRVVGVNCRGVKVLFCEIFFYFHVWKI